MCSQLIIATPLVFSPKQLMHYHELYIMKPYYGLCIVGLYSFI